MSAIAAAPVAEPAPLASAGGTTGAAGDLAGCPSCPDHEGREHGEAWHEDRDHDRAHAPARVGGRFAGGDFVVGLAGERRGRHRVSFGSRAFLRVGPNALGRVGGAPLASRGKLRGAFRGFRRPATGAGAGNPVRTCARLPMPVHRPPFSTVVPRAHSAERFAAAVRPTEVTPGPSGLAARFRGPPLPDRAALLICCSASRRCPTGAPRFPPSAAAARGRRMQRQPQVLVARDAAVT